MAQRGKDWEYFDRADSAIKAMDRENLEAFGRLKLAKWDQVNIIKTVMEVYRTSAKKARKRYYGIAFEAYVIGLMMCGVDAKKAHSMAEDKITLEWVDRVLSETDFVTLYRFNTEMERKAYRLSEELEVAPDRSAEIDKALRFWCRQLGQYALNVTDYAVMEAIEDAGAEMVQWITERDERVCTECRALDGRIFRINEVPRKPHMNCRCRVMPVGREERR